MRTLFTLVLCVGLVLSLVLPVAGRGQGAGAQYALLSTASVGASPATAPAAHTVIGEDIVTTARRYIGVPYRMGGVTPHAFDCSGFIRYVYAKHGIALPRTAHEQAALGDAPAVGDSLMPGDLLFFYGGQGAQHVAMYVGADTIIHASSTGHRVRYDLLTRREWFRERLIAVRRILPLSY